MDNNVLYSAIKVIHDFTAAAFPLPSSPLGPTISLESPKASRAVGCQFSTLEDLFYRLAPGASFPRQRLSLPQKGSSSSLTSFSCFNWSVWVFFNSSHRNVSNIWSVHLDLGLWQRRSCSIRNES